MTCEQTERRLLSDKMRRESFHHRLVSIASTTLRLLHNHKQPHLNLILILNSGCADDFSSCMQGIVALIRHADEGVGLEKREGREHRTRRISGLNTCKESDPRYQIIL